MYIGQLVKTNYLVLLLDVSASGI